MEAIAVMVVEKQFTINEVAEMIRISERTVRRWIKSGRLRAIKIPGRGRAGVEYRIPESAISDLGFKIKDEEEK
jgi:excisionase family DNA binding protein